MVVWNLLFFTILLPLVAIALLWRRPRQPAARWVATLVLAAGIAGFSVLAAPWGWFGVPLRFVIALLFALAVVMSLRNPPQPDATPTSPFRILLMALIGMFFGVVAIGMLRAYRVPFGAIDVGFPLTRGTYLVAQGGSEPAANIHAQHPAQRYAVELVKLNSAGMRARGIYPNDAKAYAIFGETVVSPCDGTVVAAIDAFPDAARISLDEKNPLGNHVTLRCGDADVTLAHLQRGSVAVRTSATVARGTPLGRVGNSGTSTEPHLQIHAERHAANSTASVPLRLDGRWLVRNAIIRK
jgi:Peptidase family M23